MTVTYGLTDAPPVHDLLQSIDQLNLTEMKVFEMKREVMMQSSTHSQHVVGGGEPTVQVHGVASRHEHTSKQIGDQPAVQVSQSCTVENYIPSNILVKIDKLFIGISRVYVFKGSCRENFKYLFCLIAIKSNKWKPLTIS